MVSVHGIYAMGGEITDTLLRNDQESAIMSSASVLTVPRRWLNFLRRCMGLQQGRYIIVLTVDDKECDWSLQPTGKVEQ